ncbi:MAG TPA: methyltransferase domain-containing protein, partial [Puia sp.]
EPNKEMRKKSVELLNHYPKYTTVDGKAENTNLPAGSVDAVVAGQAFHWFDAEKAKAEFKRILKPAGLVVLIWNERRTVTSFENEYDDLIRKHGKDYVKVDHRNIRDTDIEIFFYPAICELNVFDNQQTLDLDGLKGRLLSSSYMPARGESGYPDMIRDLEKLFEKHKENNRITINYDTKLYAGRFQ